MFCNLERLSGVPDKLVLFVGVGNVLHRDDGVGVYLAQKLQENKCIQVLNVEVGIENYIGKINKINPDYLVLIDSVFFNRQPGYSQLIPVERLNDCTTNTHNISLGKICKFIKAKTYILGIQPSKVTFGEGLSDQVKKKADLLIKKINTCFSCL